MIGTLASITSAAFSQEKEENPMFFMPTYDVKNNILTLLRFPIPESKLQIGVTKNNGKTTYDFETTYSKKVEEDLEEEYKSGIRVKENYPLEGFETYLENEDKFEVATKYPQDLTLILIATYNVFKSMHEKPLSVREA